MGLAYAIDRENGTVTVYPPFDTRFTSAVPRPGGVDLDESDLITLLSDLQAGQALSEFAPKAEVGES